MTALANWFSGTALDLRLAGFGTAASMPEAARRFLPWIWVGLALLLGTGVAGKIVGALSLTCWIGIVFLGHQIGFTMGAQ